MQRGRGSIAVRNIGGGRDQQPGDGIPKTQAHDSLDGGGDIALSQCRLAKGLQCGRVVREFKQRSPAYGCQHDFRDSGTCSTVRGR